MQRYLTRLIVKESEILEIFLQAVWEGRVRITQRWESRIMLRKHSINLPAAFLSETPVPSASVFREEPGPQDRELLTLIQN